jgi:hypothetical protein
MTSEHLKLDNYERPKLHMPKKGTDLLLHSCCAPCAGEIMEALAASDIKSMRLEKMKIDVFVKN